MRSQEVVGLTLDDVDWRTMTVRLAQTKQQRQRLLPLPSSLAKAILSYLKHGRPSTASRALFVHHLPPIGQPLTAQTVRVLVRRGFVRCGIPASGSYILRHTWATWAHRRGAGLKLIADVRGHRSLDPRHVTLMSTWRNSVRITYQITASRAVCASSPTPTRHPGKAR